MKLGAITRDQAEAMASSYQHASLQVKEIVGKMGGIGGSVTAQYDGLANSYVWESPMTPGQKLKYDMAHQNWQVQWSEPSAITTSTFIPANRGGTVAWNVNPQLYDAVQALTDAAEQTKHDKEADKIFDTLKEYTISGLMTQRLQDFFDRLQKLAISEVAQPVTSA